MFTERAEVVVARPPEEVFAFVADARNRPLWDEGVGSEELISPEPIGVGSTLRTRMRSMGRDLEYLWEIAEHDPPRRVRVESTAGPFPTTLVWEVAAHREGSRATFEVSGRPGGAMRLFQPLIARNTARNLERSFPRLKEVLESR
ncbi:MAG: SRPBCC family protein [Thermoleophilaceae bacterium]|nr:SRPBCC family protein [Thermoleophilaceae bacterium]